MENLFSFNFDGSATSESLPSQDSEPYCQEITKEGRKYHTCTFPDCGKVFRFKSEFVRHSVIHTIQRPFDCPYSGCTKSFKREDALKNHVRIHSGELPYPCDECNMGFSTKAALRYHVLKHKNERPFKCSLPGCGKSFLTTAQLKQHETGMNAHKKKKCKELKQTDSTEANKRKNVTEKLEKVVFDEPEEPKPEKMVKISKGKDAFLDEFFVPSITYARELQWETKGQLSEAGNVDQSAQEDFERMIKMILNGNTQKEQGVQMCSTLMGMMEENNGRLNMISEYMENGGEISDEKIFSVLNFS